MECLRGARPIDDMLYHHWRRMLEIEEIQMESLAERTRARTA